MKISQRDISSRVAGISFVVFALAVPNCQPSPADEGVSGTGGRRASSGKGGAAGGGKNGGSDGTVNSGGITSGGGSGGSVGSSGGGTSGSGGSGGSGGRGGSGGSGGSSGGSTSAASTTGSGGSGAGGATSGPPTCTTDLMTLRTGNLIALTPPSCSVQGYIYAYGDGRSCTAPSPITASPCPAGGTGCCISGATAVDSTGARYGCGIGLDLNSMGGAAAKAAYTGAAKGFKITITGTTVAGQKIRIMYPTTAKPPTGGTAPYKEVTGVGTYSVLFTDATCPAWATGGKCTPPSGTNIYSLQVQLAGGTSASDSGAFSNVCVTSITPI